MTTTTRARATTRLQEYKEWLAEELQLDFPDYHSLWTWSVADLPSFWASVADFFDVDAEIGSSEVLADDRMPGATWCPDVRLNLAREVFRQADSGRPAVIFTDESGVVTELSWQQLLHDVLAVAGWLHERGVARGDRVVGYIGNRPEALTAFLACASLGVMWAVCSQDVSAAGAAARFAQLEPKVLLAGSSSSYGGRRLDHSAAVAELAAALPSLVAVVTSDDQMQIGPAPDVASASWETVTSSPPCAEAFVEVPFGHPLWVLFSSGTTGVPKGLVHGHGGILLAQLAALGLHFDVGPGDRFFWFSSTSWVMWNLQVCSLLLGATAVLYEGSPTHPDPSAVWRIAAEQHVTHLGLSPGLLAIAQKEGLAPAEDLPLSALRVLGVTGAPLPAATAAWAREKVGVPLNVISGGTDVATAFVGGNPLIEEPAPGRMGPPWLGVSAKAVDAHGETVIGDTGELVITRPMPSMPLFLWNDPGMARYRETYFADFPGMWRQGDWVTFTPRPHGHASVEVQGRSDATLNRNGVRIGTAEIYAAAEALPEVEETLVVGVEQPDGGYWMPMFVHVADGAALDDDLVQRLRAAIRVGVSPRHVPDEFVQVPALPHTLTGKRLEVPVKRLLMGRPLDDVVQAEAVDRPDLLGIFLQWRASRSSSSGTR